MNRFKLLSASKAMTAVYAAINFFGFVLLFWTVVLIGGIIYACAHAQNGWQVVFRSDSLNFQVQLLWITSQILASKALPFALVYGGGFYFGYWSATNKSPQTKSASSN